MKRKKDGRAFERYPVQLTVQIIAVGTEGIHCEEKTVLENISGAGAKFTSQSIERYFLGQILELLIDLPGTSDVKAYMRVKATVVRIEPLTETSFRRDGGEGGIAVQFDSDLKFERID